MSINTAKLGFGPTQSGFIKLPDHDSVKQSFKAP